MPTILYPQFKLGVNVTYLKGSLKNNIGRRVIVELMRKVGNEEVGDA